MLFAPVVELRLKEGDLRHRRKMTGCIAGMGPKIHWNKAQVSRADLEVKFDVNVDRWNKQNPAWRTDPGTTAQTSGSSAGSTA